VTLVCGDTYHGAHAWSLADSLQHMRRAHDVRGVCSDRIRIRPANNRLRREMKDYFGREFGHGRLELGMVADVAANIVHNGPDSSQSEHVGFGAGVEGVSANLRTQPAQPEREPTPFETCVTGQKN